MAIGNRLLASLSQINIGQLELQQVETVAGQVLHHAAESPRYVFFPLSGMVSMLTVMGSGDMIETAIIGNEGAIGGWVAIGINGAGNVQSVVQVPGRAYRTPVGSYLALYRDSTLFRNMINAYCGLLLFQAQQSAGCHALHSVDQRLCRWLLMSRDLLRANKIPLTHEFLSHMLGVRRASVSSSALRLQAFGLVSYRRGAITIIDQEGLADQACECYGAIRSRTDLFLEHLPAA